MEMTNQELIADLTNRTNKNIKAVQALKALPVDTLNQKADPKSWSALESIEHLNRYGNFYLPEIQKTFLTAAQVPVTTVFKSGLIGNYFAKSMRPKEKLNKMKTFPDMNPNGSNLSADVLDTFIEQQYQMLELLTRSETIHLKKNKTSISISTILKLRLGDTFRVVIYHNERHIIQAQRAVE